MNARFLPFCCACVLGMVACSRQAPDPSSEIRAESPAPSPEAESSETAAPRVLTFDSATQQRMGLVLAPLTAAERPPEIQAYGRVLDPAPLLTFLSDIAQAQVTREASQRELARLQTLRAQDNTSERALQAAEAAAERDRIALETRRSDLLLQWGPALLALPDLGSVAHSLTQLQNALVRLEIPAGVQLSARPKAARLISLTDTNTPIPAEFLGPATTTDPQLQGQGFLFLVRQGGLSPGASLLGRIETDGTAVRGLLVPSDAVVRHAGKAWAYCLTPEGGFARRAVNLEYPIQGGYVVSEGFKTEDRVVITGAQLLLSEEFKVEETEE